MNYRREIDGLRAIAVLPVILFHAGFDTFAGGFVGVDVFFVISGYLITSIILHEQANGTFTLGSFYERRARRILPALFLVMAVCIPFAWLWMLPGEFEDFGQSLIATSLFTSNMLFWHEAGYFDVTAELKPLLHTWSLAVEEQYYLIFPMFMIVAAQRGRRWALTALGVVAAGSLALAEWGPLTNAARFFLLPTRIWELLIGVFAAYYLVTEDPRTRVQTRWLLEALGIAGIVLIFYAVFMFDEKTHFPGLNALIPTVGAVLIVLFAQPGTLTARFLGLRPLVGVGLISYGLYLWHQPLFAFARIRSFDAIEPSTFLLLTVAAFILAYASWALVEGHFRNRANRGRGAMVALPSALVVTFMITGIDAHMGRQNIKELFFKENHDRFQQLISAEQNRVRWEFTISDCKFQVSKLTPAREDKLRACAAEHGSGTLILGDSHAIDLFAAIAGNHDSPFIVGAARGGCRPHSNKRRCHYNAVRDFVRDYPGVFETVIFEQAGFYLLQGDDGSNGRRRMFRHHGINEPVPIYGINEAWIDRNLDYLADLSAHTSVVWLGARLDPHIDIRRPFLRGECSFDIRPNQRENYANIDRSISQAIAGRELDVRFVSQLDVIGYDKDSYFSSCEDGKLFWADGDHWSHEGEQHFGRQLVSYFVEHRYLADLNPDQTSSSARTKTSTSPPPATSTVTTMGLQQTWQSSM